MTEGSDPKALILNLAERNKSIPEFQFILDGPGDFTVKQFGEHGVMNIIYRVQSNDEKHSLIVKYSEDTPSHESLSSEVTYLVRQTLEYNCLMTLHNLIPGCVPQPYCLDEQLHIIAMEDLSDMELLGDAMTRGEIYPDFAGKLGKLIGKFHMMTHKKLVSEETWKDYQTSLRNEDVKNLVAFYREEIVCDEDHPVVAVPEECLQVYRQCLSEFKATGTFEMIHELNAREDCFSHADLHLYSVFFSSQRIAMIDFEFGHLGNHCYSLSSLIAFYFLLMMEAQNNNGGQEKEIEEKTKASICSLVEGFFSSFGDKIDVLGPIDQFYTEMAVFCGHVLFTELCFVAVDNVVKLNPQQKKRSLKMGHKLLKNHTDVTSLDLLMDKLFPTMLA